MADSIVGGLFGTPEAYQAQQNREALAQAAQLAQLDPFSSARTSLIYGGRQLAGVLGAQDPQLQLLSKRNAVMQGIDLNDVSSIMQGARTLSQFDPQGASALANLAREAQGKQAEATQKIAQATKAMAETGEIAAKRESLNSRVQALVDAGTPESLAKGIASNDKAFADFVAARNIATPAEYAVQARSLGFEVKPFLKDYTPEQIQAMESGVFKHKAGIAKAGATSLNVDVRQPIEISKNKTDLAAQIEKDAYSSSDRITLAQNLRNLLPRAFVGVGSDVALQAGKVAEAFGIDVKGVAPSQIIDTILNEMTVGKAGELKGALSDKDREFLKATIGTRGLSIKTLNYVADEIERRASIDRRLNSRVNNYIASGKNLNMIDFADERSQAGKDVQKDLDRLRELRQKAGQQ
jgi:hypothetical protein